MNNPWNQFANLFPNAPLYPLDELPLDELPLVEFPLAEFPLAEFPLDKNGKIRIRKNKTRRNNNHTKPLKGNSNKRPNNRVVGFANTVQVRNINKIGKHKTPSGLPTSTGLRLSNSTDNVQVLTMLAKRLSASVPEGDLPYRILMELDYLPVSEKKKWELYDLLLIAYPTLDKYLAWKKD